MIIWNSFNRAKTAIRGFFQYTRSITSETPIPDLKDEGELVRSPIESNTLGRLSFLAQNLQGYQSSIKIDGIFSVIAPSGVISEISPEGVKSTILNKPTGLLSTI